TTEVHKLPATILSRCQRFDFKRIDADKICERIRSIAQQENFTVTDGAARLIASAADGGMRDALSILDLCASGVDTIDEQIVENVCGMAGDEYLIRLADAVRKEDVQSALLLIDRLYAASADMQRLLAELTIYYRDLMIIKTVRSGERPIVCSSAKMKALEEQAGQYDLADILHALSVLQAAAPNMQTGNRRCEMEMTIIRLCRPALVTDLSALEKRVRLLENGVRPVSPAHEKTVPPPETVAETGEEYSLPDPPSAQTISSDTNGEIRKAAEWEEVLAILQTTCPLIAGVLQDSEAYFKGAYLLIDSKNDQFRSLINSGNAYYRDSIRKAAQSVWGVTYKLGPYTAAQPSAAKVDPLLTVAERLKQANND
ncbi:MAG: hypothetical protein IJT66_00525, partial [Clostridia bacterium]|nr:hypothetical protein [Clostridia bacterium]